MVMQARLGNSQCYCDVGIAESIESTGLYKPLGNVQYLLRGMNIVGFLIHGAHSEILKALALAESQIDAAGFL